MEWVFLFVLGLEVLPFWFGQRFRITNGEKRVQDIGINITNCPNDDEDGLIMADLSLNS